MCLQTVFSLSTKRRLFLRTPELQVLLPEYIRSGTGAAFLCAAAAQPWSHDAFVSSPVKRKIK